MHPPVPTIPAAPTTPQSHHPLDLYELCVQSPRHVVALLESIHGQRPVVLREDFCGTASVSARWIEDASKTNANPRALAIDLDDAALARARQRAGLGGMLTVRKGDCVAAVDVEPADIIWVGNFSIGYIHSRGDLLTYFRRSKARLDAGNTGFGGGIFACDIYGGPNAYRLGGLARVHLGRTNELIHYYWSQDSGDPMTGLVRNSISFKVQIGGEIVAELPNAFTYYWRLWSLPELCDSLNEAGFTSVQAYADLNIAPGQAAVPINSPRQLADDHIVVIAAR